MTTNGPAFVGAAVGALTLFAGVVSAQMTKDANPVDSEPVLRVPTADYRKDWVQLGTYSVLADNPEDGAKQMHTVYTERKNLEAYLNAGRFPDGAVLVKDVWGTATDVLTTGTASYPAKLEGRFVMVKDAEGKLGSGPRFGDGWGWAFFAGDETTKTITVDYKVDCLGCHEPARKTDLIYEQGYPVLHN